MSEKSGKFRLLLSLFCLALFLGGAAAFLGRPVFAQGGGNPASGGGNGEVIADVGFEVYVDPPDTLVEPPLLEEAWEDLAELSYLIPEEDTSGDDLPSAEEIEIERSQITIGGTGGPQ